MNDLFYDNLLKKWCPPLSSMPRFICAFQKIRDIPYGSTGEREPEIIVNNNLGSCSGKHILLNHLFIKLGLQSKIMTCLHHFDQALPTGNKYPRRLQEIIRDHRVIDFHHFIKLKVDQEWFNVDATWDSPLNAYGFPVNLDWQGKGQTTIAVQPIKFYPETDNIIALKEKLISELPPKERSIRAEFLELLTKWFRDIRS